MERIFDIASSISTPLILAGFLAASFFYIARQIISKDIFPVLTKNISSEIIKLIINRFFALSLIASFLGFAGYIASAMFPYVLNESIFLNSSETSVNDLKLAIISTHTTYESIDEFGEHFTEEVRGKAHKLGERMLNITDSKLSLGYKISKYEYATCAFVLAGSVELDDKKRKEYTDKSIESAQKALSFVSTVKQLESDGDKIGRSLYSWIQDDEIVEWVSYLMAVAYSIKAKDGDDQALSKARFLVDSLPTAYKQHNPPNVNKNLRWALTQEDKGGRK